MKILFIIICLLFNTTVFADYSAQQQMHDWEMERQAERQVEQMKRMNDKLEDMRNQKTDKGFF
jgi:hypothetical protein